MRTSSEHGQVPTLAVLRREASWVHWYCENLVGGEICGAHGHLALDPYIRLCGPDASSDVLRRRLVCPRCHQIGSSIRMRSWGGRAQGWQEFDPAQAIEPGLAMTVGTVMAEDLFT